MTGGVAVILGKTGRNFAAGMSGGMAFIFDEKGEFPAKCNLEMVSIEPFEDEEDRLLVRDLLIQHAGYTNSEVAAYILNDWDELSKHFVKVMPNDLKRVLAEKKTAAEANAKKLPVLDSACP
jgi:glutamate synthase domain-containing protein 3